MDRRPGFWQAVALALLGHGAVLAWFATVGPQPAPRGALRETPMAFLVRPVQWSAPAQPDIEPPAAAQATLGAPPAPEPVQQRAVPPQPVVQATAAPATPEAPAAPAAEAPYLPRGELTVPPRPLGVVDVPFPEDVAGVVDLKVRITLFIDEHGGVQRIRVDSPDVHPSFERTIRQTFAAAKFSPGERDQVAVRSQIRVEVEFQARGGRRS
ncbi:hypothetical protein [Ramlibacter sp. AN1133]|uniref:hypothetical protein n=1 Tax=Ramlibacter sp. AN1133 TaxID=3133429 RepID=UPI0030BB5F9E